MRDCKVLAGVPGHENEIVVIFDVDSYDHRHFIPRGLCDQLIMRAPDDWLIENRGTRLEVHPRGQFSWNSEDVDLVSSVISSLGWEVEVVEIPNA